MILPLLNYYLLSEFYKISTLPILSKDFLRPLMFERIDTFKMVNKNISDSCYPITVKMGKEMRNGTLVLNVIHGKELEIEYAKKDIIDKINSFFGYNCISQITLKIVQEKIKTRQSQFPKIKNLTKINEKIDKVNNSQLKSSLNNFLKAFNERNK